MDYSTMFYPDFDKRRTPFRLTETDTYRPRDRYDSEDRRPQTYKQQYSTQYMYYDTTERYDYRHDNGRPVRQSDLTEYRRHDRHDIQRRAHHHRREERRCHRDERGNSHSDERESSHREGEGRRHRDKRGSRSRDTMDEKAGQSVTCTIPTPPVDDEWLVLDVWDQEETTETIFYPELWSTHMTDGDYAQMHQWEMESDSLKQTVVNNTVKATDSLPAVSRKRSLEDETTPSMAPPAKQPRIHVNKKHAGYARLMAHRSPYRNESRFELSF